MPEAVVLDPDEGPLDAEHLADEQRKTGHRAAPLAGEDLDEPVGLLVRRALVDEDSEPPVPLGHHLRGVRDRRDPQPADVDASISPSLMLNTSVTRQ